MTTPLVKLVASIAKRELPKAGATEAATLHVSTPGTRTPGAASAGTNPTEAATACIGFVDVAKSDHIGGTLVLQTDRVVTLIAPPFQPTVKDSLTIDSLRQRIVGVEGNAAAWTCLCRS